MTVVSSVTGLIMLCNYALKWQHRILIELLVPNGWCDGLVYLTLVIKNMETSIHQAPENFIWWITNYPEYETYFTVNTGELLAQAFTEMCLKCAYRIYSNKRRISDKKVKSHPQITAAPLMLSPLTFLLFL